MAGRTLGLTGWFLDTGHLAFSTSSDVSKGWCIVTDERIVGGGEWLIGCPLLLIVGGVVPSACQDNCWNTGRKI